VAVTGIGPVELPAAVAAGLARLAHDGIHFVPVRHHSPACALALQALIREVKPAAVLIEGPDDFDALLPLLLDPATRPPVAILAQAAQAAGDDAPLAGVRSVFYPFCEYSPEWVALHEGSAAGATLAFIDRPWHAERPDVEDSDDVRSLMSDRYLAHSAYLKALAARSGCRDQDELWDHLFELRPAADLRDWRQLFADVFCYCAMARADYESAVLEADGSLPRERHMARHLRQWRAKVEGPIVVVTGGFHTIAIQQLLRDAESKTAPDGAGRQVAGQAGTQAGNWLIRYSFDRLDALNGYAAGMPAPAWYQWVWDSANASPDGPALHAITADCLAGLARRTRELGLTEQISTADVQAAALQASRLAELRGHAGPGRQDVLDAVRSCFVKGAIDEGTNGLAADIRRHLGGSRLGDIPPSAGSPPLLEDARRIAHRMGVKLDDSLARTMRFDIYRKEKHRARSRFLHLMSYLGTGLGRWQSGPDFIGGVALELLIEEWQVAWNPLVEARLIELAPLGTTLTDAAIARLRQEEQALSEQGKARSAANAVGLLTRACLIGLHQRLPSLLALIAAQLEEDGNAESVITCGHRLLLLWRGREPLGLQEHPQLRELLLQAWSGALYLLPQLADVKADGETKAIESLLALRALHGALRAMVDDERPEAATQWVSQLVRVVHNRDAAPGVRSAAAAMLFLDGAWSETELAGAMKTAFGVGAVADEAVRALRGLMAAAPELLLTQAGLRADINAIMAGWDEPTFISYLPDLRLAFALLKPQETAQLAEALAGLVADHDLLLAETHYAATEADMLAGAKLQTALAGCLERDGLAGWNGDAEVAA
jgi:hypothetical protein